MTEGKESISISLKFSWGEPGMWGRLRTGEGVKSNYNNNAIKHFYKAFWVAGTVLRAT